MVKKLSFMLAVILSIVLLEASFLSPAIVLAQTVDPVFVGAGDISNCSNTQDESTAKLLDGIAGTAAKTRVLITSTDGKREWGTVGVSENIITASLQALVDSMEYALLRK